MPFFSAFKKVRDEKLKEGIESLAVKCGDNQEVDAGDVDVGNINCIL